MDEGRFCVLSAYDMNGLPSSLDARGGGGAANTTTATPAAVTTSSGGGGGCRREDADVGSGSTRTRSACARACASFSRLGRWEVWKALLLGQVLSGLLCATGVTSQILQSSHNLQIPTAQSFVNYVLLCAVFTTWLACRGGDAGLIPVLRARGGRYFLLALVDVEANFLLVKAYQYTTLTSVQLLDCFTIPVVLALSWLALKVRYHPVHVLGVSVALLGVGCLVWADAHEAAASGQLSAAAPNRLLGDMLCLGGAALYGVSNVAQEAAVKLCGTVEFLGAIGLFGSVINGIQLALLEKEKVGEIHWDDWHEVSMLLGFSGSMFLLYLLMPVVIRLSSATAANLSILSADFYALAIGVFVFHYKFHWLYMVSFCLVIGGVALYSAKPTPLGLGQRERDSEEALAYTPSGGGAGGGAAGVGCTATQYGSACTEHGSAPLLSVSHAVSVHAFGAHQHQHEPSPKTNGAVS
ncbi:solute carrier family 35 member F2-like [Amblyomma americanum]